MHLEYIRVRVGESARSLLLPLPKRVSLLLLYNRDQISKQEKYIYIHYTNACSLYDIIPIDILIKADLKATYYTLFIIKGNHIAWDFEG